MIIVRLDGGLGNQMFQYALGRALAYRHNTHVKVDISVFGDIKMDPVREYELGRLNVATAIATAEDIARVKHRQHHIVTRLLAKFGSSAIPWHCQFDVKERRYTFDPDVFKIGRDAYLHGEWQTYKYFADIADVIGTDLQVVPRPDAYNEHLLAKVRNINAVSLHVRRGDYVSEASVREVLGALSVDYYDQAIALVKQKVEDPYFIIVSDDPEWARAHIHTGTPSEVSLNPADRPHEEMRLMYSCKHHIIANSSFSWWGAWLDPNPNKVVIAPRNWFTAKKHWSYGSDLLTQDLIPSDWIQL